MSLSTFDDLKSGVATWLGRDDLTTVIPDFITLFEASACRRLRVRLQQTTTTLSPSAGSATMPSDYLGAVRVTWMGSSPRELTYQHPSYLQATYPNGDAGIPDIYTIEGSTLKVRPVDDSSVEMLYYQRTAAVSGTLNWLFTNHPDAYLFGTLCEAEAYADNADKAALWKVRRDEVFEEIKLSNFRDRPTMQIRVAGFTP